MDPDTLGLLGFILAVALALLRVWEALFHKPKFEVDFRFNVDGRTSVVDSAYLIVMNIGRAKGGVLHVRFLEEGVSADSGLGSMTILNELPLVLDADDARRLSIPIAGYLDGLAQKLVKGDIRNVVLVDLKNRRHLFPLPFPPKLPDGAVEATFERGR